MNRKYNILILSMLLGIGTTEITSGEFDIIVHKNDPFFDVFLPSELVPSPDDSGTVNEIVKVVPKAIHSLFGQKETPSPFTLRNIGSGLVETGKLIINTGKITGDLVLQTGNFFVSHPKVTFTCGLCTILLIRYCNRKLQERKLQNSYNKTTQSIKDIAQQVDNIGQDVDTMEDNVKKMNAQIETMNQHVNTTKEMIKKRQNTLVSNIENVKSRIENVGQVIQESINKYIEKSKNQLSNTSKTCEEIKQTNLQYIENFNEVKTKITEQQTQSVKIKNDIEEVVKTILIKNGMKNVDNMSPEELLQELEICKNQPKTFKQICEDIQNKNKNMHNIARGLTEKQTNSIFSFVSYGQQLKQLKSRFSRMPCRRLLRQNSKHRGWRLPFFTQGNTIVAR